MKVYKRSLETRNKIKLSKLGKTRPPLTSEWKEKIRESSIGKNVWMKGKKLSKEWKINISKGQQGNKSHFRKGGVTEVSKLIRESFKYNKWRQDVFIRDSFICQECGQIGGELEVHHIKSFSILIEEVKINLPLFNLYDGAMIYNPLWDLSNGITYCKECHKEV